MLRNRQVRVGGIFNARVFDGRWWTCARNGWPLNPAVLALPQSFRPIPHRLNATWPMSRAIPKMSACRLWVLCVEFGMSASCRGVISEVRLPGFAGSASLATFDTTLRLRGLSSFCMDHLSHRPSRSWSARSKSRRWRNSVAVLFVTKFQDQVTSATVESPEPRYPRNALSEFEFNQASRARS